MIMPDFLVYDPKGLASGFFGMVIPTFDGKPESDLFYYVLKRGAKPSHN